MTRRILVTATLAALTSLVVLSPLACKNPGATTDADGGHAPKMICKMNNQCWICPDEEAMKKCIINPATSGCKQGAPGDCT
jgi:hypothetical protein